MAGKIDIKLDPVSHDLVTSGRDLSFVREKDWILQRLKQNLWLIAGEYYRDTSRGIRYFEDVWRKRPNITVVEAMFKIAILNTEGVSSLLKWDLSYNAQTREFTLSFEVDTVFGVVDVSEQLI